MPDFSNPFSGLKHELDSEEQKFYEHGSDEVEEMIKELQKKKP